MRIADLMQRARVAAEGRPDRPVSRPAAPAPRWYLIESTVFGDRFVYCTEKKLLKEVRRLFPGVAVYFPPEIEELYALEEGITREEWCELVRHIHLLKKKARGWIVPGGKIRA